MKLDAKVIIQKLQSSKRAKDYSLVIVFFVVFSVFVWFAIRPNLITAFSLQQELTELREKDAHYEEVILSIVDFQSKLESNRDRLYLLDEALPQKPLVHDIVVDIQDAAEESNLSILRLELREVEVLSKVGTQNMSANTAPSQNNRTVPQQKEYMLTIASQSSEESINTFMNNLTSNRRLKLVNQLVFSPNIRTSQDSTASASLRVQFEVTGLYL